MHTSRWFLSALLMAMLCIAPMCTRAQGPRSTTNIGTLPNDTTVGTTLYFLAKKQPGGPGGKAKLVVASATDTTIPLYPVTANAGISGSAVYILNGEGPCVFDNTTTSKGGSYVVVGTGGRCHQADVAPTPGMVLGVLNDDSTTNGQTSLVDFQNTPYSAPPGAGSGTVTSVALTMPAEFTVATTTPTVAAAFAVSKANVSANCVLAGPASGGPAAWSCRGLTSADLSGLSVPVSGTAGGDLSGTYPNPSVVKASGQFAYAGVLTTSLSGPVDNWSPTGPPDFPVATIIRVTATTATVRITGLAAQGNGTIKNICNYGTTNALVLSNQDTASSVTNRLALAPLNQPAGLSDDMTLPPGQCKPLWYDSGNQRWYPWDGTPEDYLKMRPFSLFVGDPDPSSPALLAGNDSPTVWTNLYHRPLKFLAMTCKVDAGTLTIQPIITGQSATSIVTGPCTCGVGAFGTPCALTGQPMLQPATNAGQSCPAGAGLCSLDFNIQTTDGTAKVLIGNIEAILQ